MAISRPFAATIGSPHDIVRTLHCESVRTSHIPAHCMSIRRRPCSRKHTADMLMYRSTFVPSRHVACLLACFAVAGGRCLLHEISTLASSHDHMPRLTLPLGSTPPPQPGISHYTVTILGFFASSHWIPHLQVSESHPEPPQGVHKNLAIDRHPSGDTLDTDTECCLDVPAYSEHNIKVSRDEPARQSRSVALVPSSYEMILLLFVCHLPGQRW